MPGWGLFVVGYMTGISSLGAAFYLWLIKQSRNP